MVSADHANGRRVRLSIAAPTLSKPYRAGEAAVAQLILRRPSFFAARRIPLRSGV
jgi:hypothetical protein